MGHKTAPKRRNVSKLREVFIVENRVQKGKNEDQTDGASILINVKMEVTTATAFKKCASIHKAVKAFGVNADRDGGGWKLLTGAKILMNVACKEQMKPNAKATAKYASTHLAATLANAYQVGKLIKMETANHQIIVVPKTALMMRNA